MIVPVVYIGSVRTIRHAGASFDTRTGLKHIRYHTPSMDVVIAPPHPLTGRFRELDLDRREPSEYFARWVSADARMKGRILDVGCGSGYPSRQSIRAILEAAAQHDGVDPTDGVMHHPGLKERWCAPFEDAPLPAETYDALFSFWVAEHVASPDRFMAQAYRVLKPEGAFYGFTPHALHPFPVAVRLIQLVNVKRWAKRRLIRRATVFPAYYRFNSQGAIVRAAERAGFLRAEFHYLPSLQWDRYFPAPLRFLPHAYDRLVGIRVQRCAALLAFRVEKAGSPTRKDQPFND
jgi:SAM-dependent methyltransferase